MGMIRMRNPDKAFICNVKTLNKTGNTVWLQAFCGCARDRFNKQAWALPKADEA